MASLIESVLSLEQQAGGVVAEAHAGAKKLEAETAERIEAIRREVSAAVEARTAEYRGQAEAKLEADLAAAAAEHAAAMAKLGGLSQALLDKQSALVVDRLRGK